ncbi:Protein of unknown function [Propionibacterium freudenreichii]|nr:Protein of unknown function [Propionibacterium freudenreichii]CEP25762.1 Protein of unknown function [Propionibacterium freudenreichii subsp. freudenreichii]CEG93651.1 Protein of unknown function [Propionibacterium freudenreichii]CEH00278.1 Protein of unknown function [Propionibacterium freudenreichii]CEH05906.1 Protein of unknown function [Propionibacterium freudenreichii]
MQSTGNA